MDKEQAGIDTFPKLLTVKEAADVLRYSPEHIYNLITKGMIRAIKTGGRSIRIPSNSIQEFINKNS